MNKIINDDMNTLAEWLCEVENLLNIMNGYCINSAENSDEMNNLLAILKIVLKKQKLIIEKIDNVSCDVLRISCPELFNS